MGDGLTVAPRRVRDEHLQRVLQGEACLVFDGAMGTMLQRSGIAAGELPELLCLTDPLGITAVHRAYVEAGSQAVTTNTFGASSLKLGGKASVDEVFAAAVQCARESGAQLVAADIGPTGELMFPMGELEFSQACELFAEQARAAEAAGADLVIIETMADVLEMTAAVVSVRQSCTLPVFATMTFTASGRTFLGTAPGDAALALSALGVDALGVNCSAGPADLQPVVSEMLEVASCPVIVQANAGLPEVIDGVTSYSMVPGDYAAAVLPMVEAGAAIVGGCCGTDPSYIAEVAKLVEGRKPAAAPISREAMLARAREAADAGGRDAEILEMILDAGSLDGLAQSLADEYDG